MHVPSAAIGALLLGAGTRVTHQAMVVLADSGSTAVWVGERGVRYYAHGRTLARTSRWLIRQAEVVSNQRSRLAVARRMYEMRFPDEDVSKLSMQQLRGREGARENGIEWRRRDYRPDDFAASDDANMALSAATTCLYGVVHAVVVSLGCAPGLGVVHTGHDRSFVFDIADLYKVELAVPVAFRVAASESEDVPGDVQRGMRDAIHAAKLLGRCARDVQLLLGGDGDEVPEALDWDVIDLWDGGLKTVPGGVAYGGGGGRGAVVVIVLTACPVGLRGYLTRWLLEISAGVFVGRINPRVRDRLWDRVLEMVKDGKAIMVFTAPTEQGLDFRVHRHDWEPVDLDGLRVMLRPAAPAPTKPALRPGWSTASRARRASGRRK